ncbi:MAG: SPOR domain-containing protein [Sphingomicrobium sp.]
MMRDVRLARTAVAAVLAMAAAAPLPAQYIGNAPPPPLPAAPPPGTLESPAAALGRAVRTLAASPRDFAGLMAAGRAELELGDLQSAVGFFGRADEVRPSDPAPKVGMGATTVQTGDARGALGWFDQAQRLGASPALLGADRGLAHDLLGELDAAQADYRAALSGPTPAEARRRLALSLAMGGRMNDALVTLQPLLNQRDVAAHRVRAFVLALGGQQALAVQAIGQAMPGAADRIGPFFSLLPRLSLQQKAAAVHLGVFPNPGEMQLAAAEPVRAAPQPSTARPSREAKAKALRIKGGTLVIKVSPSVAPPPPTLPVVIVAPPVAAPSTSLPSGAETATAATLNVTRPAVADLQRYGPPVPPPMPVDRLSGIDRLLETVGAQPKAAPGAPPKPRAYTTRAAKKAADDKARKDKAAANKQAKDDKQAASALGVAGAHWVQLAGGFNADRMATEYKRLRAKGGSLLKARAGYVTAGKDYFRLLVGPFDSADDARAFVNKLDKTGVDSFSWTRSPAQIKIEKLPSK